MVAQTYSRGQDLSQFDNGVSSQKKILDRLNTQVNDHYSKNPNQKVQQQANSFPKDQAIQGNDKKVLQDSGLIGKQNQQSVDSSQDISQYVFKKLEGFGYPPRRLQEFKQDFLQQKLYPGGMKDVTVTIPDRYYGTNKRLSDKDYNILVNEIQDKFNLQFQDGSRGKDKKIIMNFMTKTSQSAESNQQQSAPDILDQVYGTGNGKKQPKQKQASVDNMLSQLFIKKGNI